MQPTGDRMKEYLKAGVEYYRKMSQREKVIIAAALCVAAFMGIYEASVPIIDAFESQQTELLKAEENLSTAARELARYTNLKSRRDEIENVYKAVEIKEGIKTHLENLIKTKAGVTDQFRIREGLVRDFGEKYQRASFTVDFTISDLPHLVEYLRELVQGTKPLALTSLKLSKRPAGDMLEVTLEVSSIREKSEKNPA